MFDLRGFVKQGVSDAMDIGDNRLLRLTAAGWYDKGVLTKDDLAEIDAAIDAKNGVADGEECVCVEGEG